MTRLPRTEGTGADIDPQGCGALPVSKREGSYSWERFCLSKLRLITSVTHVLGPSTWAVDWTVMMISVLVAHMQQLPPYSCEETWVQGEETCPHQ